MNLETEKKALIKQVEQVNDIRLLRAVKSMLDYGLNKEESLEASLERALEQSEKGEGRPHEQVMNDLRQRYKI
jgi:predicted transcriptional regulator